MQKILRKTALVVCGALFTNTAFGTISPVLSWNDIPPETMTITNQVATSGMGNVWCFGGSAVTASNFVVESGADVVLNTFTGGTITLGNGFHAQAGSHFSTDITHETYFTGNIDCPYYHEITLADVSQGNQTITMLVVSEIEKAEAMQWFEDMVASTNRYSSIPQITIIDANNPDTVYRAQVGSSNGYSTVDQWVDVTASSVITIVNGVAQVGGKAIAGGAGFVWGYINQTTLGLLPTVPVMSPIAGQKNIMLNFNDIDDPMFVAGKEYGEAAASAMGGLASDIGDIGFHYGSSVAAVGLSVATACISTSAFAGVGGMVIGSTVCAAPSLAMGITGGAVAVASGIMKSVGNSVQVFDSSGVGNTKPTPSQIQRSIEKGQAPNSVDSLHYKNLTAYEKVHIHFTDGAALNIDGTWKHNPRSLTNAEVNWLQEIKWGLPQ